MSEETMSLKEFKEKYKEKWSGMILKEVCDKCGSENILICKDGEPPEIYPLAKCIDCGNKMYHDHYCWICGEAGEDGLVCLKCSDKYTMGEINELIKKMGEKEQIIKKFEKINEELYKEVEELSQHKWDSNEMNDIKYLMSVVSEIIQFLEFKFPNALDVRGIPLQKTIFQNARYRLYKRMNKIREKKNEQT